MVELGSLLPLIYNGALLLGLAFLYDLLAIPARDGAPTRPQQLLLGAGVGVIGVILMLTPWRFNEGVVFDTRSVLLSISGLFFGVVPTVVAMLMTSALRIYQGGAGALTGVSVIVVTGCMGIGWRLWRQPALATLSWRELYRFGWIVHGVMLFLFMVTLPLATAQQVLAAITVPVLLIYPLATMLLGQLLVNRQRRELAAEALLASEQRHRSYVDSAPYGVLVIDATGAYLEANPAACQISGYSLDELLQLRITDLLTADAQSAGLQHFQQVFATGQAYGEYAMHRKDGSIWWSSVAAVRLSPTRALGFLSDVTERKTTQEALQQAEKDYRDLYEHAPDLFLSVDTATGRIIQCNETLAKALGYPKEELLGQRVVDFYAPGQEAIYQQISHTFATTGQIQDAELQIHRKDGTLLHVILNATAVRDEQGKILHSHASWRDVSERKAAEQLAAIAQTALRQNEERFRHVASSISDIAYSCVAPAGAGYRLEWMTGAAERITGYTVDEIIAMGCWVHLVTAEDEPLFAEHITGLAVGATSTCEVRLHTRHGEIVWVAVTAECVADGTGRRLYGAVVDITDRKRAEAALRQSEEKAVALINATSEAAFLMTPDGVVLAHNMELARRFNMPASDIIGHTIYDFLPPQVAKRRSNIVQEVVRTRQPLRFRDENIQSTVDNSIYPILDVNGEVTQLAIYARDVTAQMVAEERYQTLFREMLDGFALHEIICDEQGRPIDYRFVDVNPAFERLTGLRAKAVIGRTILEVLPTTEPHWIDTYGRVALTGEPLFMENFSQAIGRYFEVTAFSPAANQFATIFVDVTERRRVETALRRRDALLEALSFAADRFLQVTNWEQVMPEVLEHLGNAAAVSRVYLFQNDTKPSGHILSSQRFEWCAPGVSPQIENKLLQNVPFGQIGFIVEPRRIDQRQCA
jgi:PAS domain S-box-containing protein